MSVSLLRRVELPLTENQEKRARIARRALIEAVYRASSSHLGSSLSCIEILISSLDFAGEADSLIISKGHAAAGLYASLFANGAMPEDVLQTYGQNGTVLFGHVSKESGHGIQFSSGSLGHGLPFGIGLALGARLSGSQRRVVVVMSDGELNEGTTWESALLASHHELANLTVIVDRNGIQSIGKTEETLALEPLEEKWLAFGWNVIKVDGHSFEELNEALNHGAKVQPTVILAQTIKGKGVSFMEGDNVWHYKPPTKGEMRLALAEIGVL